VPERSYCRTPHEDNANTSYFSVPWGSVLQWRRDAGGLPWLAKRGHGYSDMVAYARRIGLGQMALARSVEPLLLPFPPEAFFHAFVERLPTAPVALLTLSRSQRVFSAPAHGGIFLVPFVRMNRAGNKKFSARSAKGGVGYIQRCSGVIQITLGEREMKALVGRRTSSGPAASATHRGVFIWNRAKLAPAQGGVLLDGGRRGGKGAWARWRGPTAPRLPGSGSALRRRERGALLAPRVDGGQG
jgi:hypothetical protein